MSAALDTAPAPAAGHHRQLRPGWALVAFLTLTHVAVDGVTSMLSALLPTLQVRFDLTETALAGLVGVLWFSTSVTQPLFGALADRFGSRGLIAFGTLGTTGLLSLVAVAPAAWALFLLLLVGGLGSAAFHPSAMGVAHATGGRRKGLTVSVVNAGGTVGLALGPVAVLALLAAGGVQATMLLMVPGLVLGGLVFLLVPRAAPAAAPAHGARAGAPRLLDRQVLRGPVPLLSLAVILSSVASVTFTNAVPLWMVQEHGVARDSALLGWTLATYNLAAASGGVIGGLVAARVRPVVFVPGTMLAAVLPLFAVLAVEPGSPAFLIGVVLAGAAGFASLPVLIVTAQDLAPRAVATASAMVMGFATGAAGVLYVGVGWLQGVLGLVPAMRASYLLLVPAALLALTVLRRHATAPVERARTLAAATRCTCAPCTCAHCVLAAA